MIWKPQKYLAELVGTFVLVTMGCGAVIVDQLSGGRLTLVGVSLVFGLAVLAMIYAVGHISGAHLNPAVTLGFFAAGRLEGKEVSPYVASQLLGALLASLFLRVIFGGNTTLAVTLPSGPWVQSFAVEFVMTFVLMFVIMGVATDHRAQGMMAGVAIGGTICFEALFGGPISGASMNPARSFGPALVAGNFSAHWVYWAAPVLGSLLGVAVYKGVRCGESTVSKSGCC